MSIFSFKKKKDRADEEWARKQKEKQAEKEKEKELLAEERAEKEEKAKKGNKPKKTEKGESYKDGSETETEDLKPLRGRRAKREPKIAPFVLKAPHISEKAVELSDHKNQYIFKVFPKANKQEIKKAIEEIYNVEVEKVNIINIKGKTKRFLRTEGKRSGYKKAIVKIKEGQEIEILPR